MADEVTFFGKSFTPKLLTKKIFFLTKLIFWKNAIFEKSEKIHSDSPKYYANIRSVKKVQGLNHSKRPLKEIVKNLFGAKLAPLSSILTWSSSSICHLVCSQCRMLSVYIKCVSRCFQLIKISNKEDVSNVALQIEFRVRNCWKLYKRLTVNQLY